MLCSRLDHMRLEQVSSFSRTLTNNIPAFASPTLGLFLITLHKLSYLNALESGTHRPFASDGGNSRIRDSTAHLPLRYLNKGAPNQSSSPFTDSRRLQHAGRKQRNGPTDSFRGSDQTYLVGERPNAAV